MKNNLKRTTASLVALSVLTLAFPALAAKSPTNLLATPWRIYNILPGSNSLWDINKVQYSGGVLSFPFHEFQTTTSGSFAVYLENNYNLDITNKTITADVNWTPGTNYISRSGVPGDAHVRLEFQDVTSGPFTSNDYWWNTGNLDLNLASSGTLTGSLADRSQWTNICGQSATDTTPHPGPNCVGGTDPAVSPYDGFTKAMKNVKQVSLSFGRASSYASGVATVASNSSVFNMTGFTIAP
jgi:hypothetical protein